MAANWDRYTLLLLFFAFALTGCGFFQSNQITFQDEPVILSADFTEIKEQHHLDEYGLDEQALVKEARVKRNESLYTILSEFDVEPQVIYEIDRAAKGVYRTNTLRVGQNYSLYANTQKNDVDRMIINLNALEYVVIDWGDKISVNRGQKEITTVVEETSGIITSSLYESLQEANVTTLLGAKLSEIYGWQVDFFRLQKNDSYKVVYELQLVDGELFDVGQVLAASFTHKGNEYKAFYYDSGEQIGYYDEEGNALQKALLKAPFKYSQRISSGFSHNRFHPVLHKNMPHYGVDYAAPLGTPVLATGDGEVIEAQYRGANGNIVKIKHNSVYTTAYLHLNGFASGVRKGVKVRQGQVIGYVGRTGRVTGVHLDYRIYKNDQPVNPLRIELPPTKSLTGSDLQQYKLFIERYRYRLDDLGSNLLAASF